MSANADVMRSATVTQRVSSKDGRGGKRGMKDARKKEAGSESAMGRGPTASKGRRMHTVKWTLESKEKTGQPEDKRVEPLC